MAESAVTVKAWESLAEDNTVIAKCGDLEFKVTKTIPYDKAAYIVTMVSEVVFDEEEDAYRPEIKEVLIRSNILEHYANFRMPKSFDKTYQLVLQTDAYDIVSAHINEDQEAQIRTAIDEDIAYRMDVKADAVKAELDRVVKTIGDINSKYAVMFDGMSDDEMGAFVKNISSISGGVDEEKLVEVLKNYQSGE